MEDRTRINWTVLAIGFAVATLLAILLLPSTQWIALMSHRQVTGEKDLWNLGEHRITEGNDDAQLARILLGVKPEHKLSVLDRFVDRDKPRIDALAHWCRYSFISVPRRADGTYFVNPETAEHYSEQAHKGAALEPNNAYWPLFEACQWWLAGDTAKTDDALHRAAQCNDFNDHGIEEADLVISQLERSSRLTEAEKAMIYGSVMYPHVRFVTMMSKEFPTDNLKARADLALASITMAKRSNVLVPLLVGLASARYAAVPDYDPRKEEDKGRFEEAFAELASIRPDLNETIAGTPILLSSADPRRLSEEDEIHNASWDLLFNGLHIKLFSGAVLWLIASVVFVAVGRVLVRLNDYPWVAKVAPFCGFLLFGWITLSTTEMAAQNVLLWDYYVPELSAFGAFLGLVALKDSWTKFARWAGLVVSLPLVLAAGHLPVLFLPLVAVWVSLALAIKKPDTKTTSVLASLSPALLTLPLAIVYIADLGSGVLAFGLIVIVLAVPLAWSASYWPQKGHWAALSVIIPCLFLLYTVRMNLVADAAIGKAMQYDLQRADQLRQTWGM